MTDHATDSQQPDPPMGVSSSEGLGAGAEACESCKYWKARDDGSGLGTCRRFPPVADGLQLQQAAMNGHDSGEDYASEWSFFWGQPCCAENDWCGEWMAPNVGVGPRR